MKVQQVLKGKEVQQVLREIEEHQVQQAVLKGIQVQ